MTRKRFRKLLRAKMTEFYLQNPYQMRQLYPIMANAYRVVQNAHSSNYEKSWEILNKVLS